MKRLFFLPVVLLAALLLTAGCSASQQAATSPADSSASSETPSDLKPYAKVITDEAETDDGLFTVHRLDEKVYYEIPDSLMNSEMLLVSRIAKTADEIGYGGEKANTHVVRWQRQGQKVLLRVVSYENVADPDEPIYEAVRNANFEPIMMSFDVEALSEDQSGVVIDATPLYESDVPSLGLQQDRREEYEVRSLDTDRTFVSSAKSFPENVEVRAVLTYEAQEPPSNSDTGTISLEMAHSMVLLPKDLMQPRMCDERVGYFNVEQVNYGLDRDRAEEQCFITRWRLEPSDSAAYARGELVEPKKPIVYYIDPATPERYRPYLKQGVEDWNEAFEAAGFKNAIIAKDAPTPEEDPDWSAEDVRYSVIRYFPSQTQNAYGPHVHDPRTGEILESDIGWFHNVSNLVRNWYFVQTAAANPKARATEFSDEVQGQLVRFVAAHEVGHTLGLPHNWGSSFAFPVDSLRSPSFTSTHGTAPSIMDYARFNYIAQPGDGVTNFLADIGTYDKWAIEWGYTRLPQFETAAAEEALLDEWIREHADDPRYFYGQQTGGQVDPRSQREDLGNDAVKASRYGLRNLERIVPNLIEWTYASGEDFDQLEELYGSVLGQWQLYIGHVARQIGGVYETPKTYDQDGLVYTAVPEATQKEAMQFMQEEVFTKPDWLLDPAVLRRIENVGALERVREMQVDALEMLLSPQRLARLIEAEALQGDSTYTPAEMMDDLRAGLWSELESGEAVNPYRRNLQRGHIERLAYLMNEEPDAPPEEYRSYFGYAPFDVSQSDVRPYVRGELKALQRALERAAPRTRDRTTRLHFEDALARVEALLDPRAEMATAE